MSSLIQYETPEEETISRQREMLVMVQSWLKRFSPTAPCIDGVDRIHPMLEAVNDVLDDPHPSFQGQEEI